MLSASMRFAVAVAQAAVRGAPVGEVVAARQHLEALSQAAQSFSPVSHGAAPLQPNAQVLPEDEALACAALLTARSVCAATQHVKFPALRTALASAWDVSSPHDGSCVLATACSVAALATTEATEEELKYARAAASILTLTMPRDRLESHGVSSVIADILSVALVPPPDSIEESLDVKCASILARSLNLQAQKDHLDSASLRAAALQVADKLLQDCNDTDNSSIGACIALVSQLQLLEGIPAARLVEIATQRGMWETAEDVVDVARRLEQAQDGDRKSIDFTAAATALVSAALEASRYRQGDLCARRFGISAQFPDASLLHARDTISKLSRKSQINLVESVVDDASPFMNSERIADLRAYAIECLGETGEFALALELSHRWGLLDTANDSHEALEARLESARAARRERHISFDDIAKPESFRLAALRPIKAPRSLVDTPSGLAEAIAILSSAPDGDRMKQAVVGFDVEWASELHSRSSKKRARLASTGSSGAAESQEDDNGNTNSKGKPTAALLQLASRDNVFLIDMATLSETSTGREALASHLGPFFDDEKVIKLGFGATNDLSVLARATLPYQLFRAGSPKSLVDLKGEGPKISPVLKDRGLKEYSVEFLGKPLDKSEQCSNWSIRPLRQSQMEYAAIDAWVLVAIWERIQVLKADMVHA